MGEKKTTLLEINIEDAGGFEFSPSPHFGGELAEKVEELEGKGSKLGLFGSKGEAEEEGEDADEDSSGGLFSRKSKETLEDEEAEETHVEVEEAEEAGEEESGGGLGLVIGLLFLLVVAAAARKFVAGDIEEYEEVELSEYEN